MCVSYVRPPAIRRVNTHGQSHASGLATGYFAQTKQYSAHRRWAIRHVGAGLWVSAQRPFYAVLRLAQVLSHSKLSTSLSRSRSLPPFLLPPRSISVNASRAMNMHILAL